MESLRYYTVKVREDVSTRIGCMKVLHVSHSFYPAHVYGGTISSEYGVCLGRGKLGSEVHADEGY